jgi:hypothetical protein
LNADLISSTVSPGLYPGGKGCDEHCSFTG